MRAIEQMLSATPNRVALDRRLLEDCIEACVECELACTGCADACLGAKDVDPLRRCIRLNQDCAGACNLTARVLVRQFSGDRNAGWEPPMSMGRVGNGLGRRRVHSPNSRPHPWQPRVPAPSRRFARQSGGRLPTPRRRDQDRRESMHLALGRSWFAAFAHSRGASVDSRHSFGG
jgi:hypothetical protein